MKSNLYIGLSGGIASGKTIVSDEFSSLGADIIDTDKNPMMKVNILYPELETNITYQDPCDFTTVFQLDNKPDDIKYQIKAFHLLLIFKKFNQYI